jgi:hypothetical protein
LYGLNLGSFILTPYANYQFEINHEDQISNNSICVMIGNESNTVLLTTYSNIINFSTPESIKHPIIVDVRIIIKASELKNYFCFDTITLKST